MLNIINEYTDQDAESFVGSGQTWAEAEQNSKPSGSYNNGYGLQPHHVFLYGILFILIMILVILLLSKKK